jgi:hypothetical protein
MRETRGQIMIDELGKAYEAYAAKWSMFINDRSDKAFFEGLKPTAVAWKTEDLADFEARFMELRNMCDKVFLTWMNERWVAKMHLKDDRIAGSITIIKLMQRRPDSTDAVGLDHVDFYGPKVAHAEDMLGGEPNVKWTHEENGPCKWISVWFADTEAKLRTDTVLGVIIGELQELEKQVLAEL